MYLEAAVQPSEHLKHAIRNLYMILHPAQTLPTDLKKAVQSVNEMAKSEDHEDGGLSAVFVGIASGKNLTKTAGVLADKATKDLQFMDSATSDFQGVADLLEVFSSGKAVDLQAAPEILATGIKAIDKVKETKSNQSTSEAVNAFLVKAKETLFRLIPLLGKHIVKHRLLPWMTCAVDMLKSQDLSVKLEPVVAIDLQSLLLVTQKPALEKCSSNLSCAIKLYQVIISFDECFGDTVGDINTVKTVSLIKNLTNYLNVWSSPLDLIDSSASKTGFDLLSLVRGLSASRAVRESGDHAKKVAKLLLRATFQHIDQWVMCMLLLLL